MKKWNAYIQVNGDGQSIYEPIVFDISDEMFDKIQAAIANSVPLFKCPFYRELSDIAENAFDLAEYLEITDDEPERDDYDDEEEYQEAMDEYKESIERVWDEYSFVDVIIDDPGDEDRFIKHFIGKIYPDYDGVESEDFEWEDCDGNYAIHSLTVYFDGNGKIVAIDCIEALGLEWESERNSSYANIYPDYDLMKENLEEALGFEADPGDVDNEEDEE